MALLLFHPEAKDGAYLSCTQTENGTNSFKKKLLFKV